MKSPGTAKSEPGALLRYWRRQRGKSQMELALDAGVSQRYVSFVESGRSAPSRDFLVTLSQVMDIPLRERNLLPLAGGYAPLYLESGLDAPEMAVVKRAVDRMLLQQEPYPALLLDRYWNVLKTNEAAPRFFGSFVDLSRRKQPRNLLDLMFDPEGMRPFVEDWETVAAGLLERVARETVGHLADTRTAGLLESMRRYPGVAELRSGRRVTGPVLPITFVRGEERMSYFSLVTRVGTPQTVSAQELRIECMFPAEREEDLPGGG